MVRFSRITIPSLYSPQMFFADMIAHQTESFKHHVNEKNLQELVKEVLLRASEGQYGFDHLQRSTSRMHRYFKPLTEQTVFLLKRIL